MLSLNRPLLGLYFLLLVVIGCTPKHQVIRPLISTPEKIIFSDVQALVLNTNCVSCHNSQKKANGVDLSSLKAILERDDDRGILIPYDADSSSIFNVTQVNGKRHMPPLKHPQLSQDQILLLRLWIENGAKENFGASRIKDLTVDQKIAPYLSNPESIDFEVVRKYVFANTCIKCHSRKGVSPSSDAMMFGVDLTSYNDIFFAIAPGVVKGKPEASAIFQAIAIKKNMPPVKHGYIPLKKYQVKLVELWISYCAIESANSENIDRSCHEDL